MVLKYRIAKRVPLNDLVPGEHTCAPFLLIPISCKTESGTPGCINQLAHRTRGMISIPAYSLFDLLVVEA